MDPVAKTALQRKVEAFVMALLYKLKILLLGIVVKTIWMFFLPVCSHSTFHLVCSCSTWSKLFEEEIVCQLAGSHNDRLNA